MTIEPMSRITLCGPLREKEMVVTGLQELGCLHLIPLSTPGPLEPEDPAGRRRAQAAYRHLTDAPRQRRRWPRGKGIDLDAAITAILANKERLRVARDRRDFLNERIANLEVFGDFRLPPGDALRGMKLWFYVLPLRDRSALNKLELPWQIVGRDTTHLYVAIVSREEPARSILPVPRTHTGSRNLSVLKAELEEIEIEIEQAEDEYAELTRHRLALGMRLAEAEDADDRRLAVRMTRDAERIFALQGWAPTNSITGICDFAERHQLAVTFEEATAEDLPPTLLQNPDKLEGTGALTSFYMTPAYSSWDPSLIVFFSFCVFFSMILADAGYAAVLGLITAWFWKPMGRTLAGKRARVMLATTVTCAFLYGVAAGSYFGIAPPEGSLPARLAFIDVKDFNTMMKASIIIGVLHITLALALSAYNNRGTGIAVAKIGWIAATIGGLVTWLGQAEIGYALIAVGLLGVFIGSGLGRSISEPRGLLMRLADGAVGLTGVTKLFGDVLSYMRLFALGLASASLAGTFNNLAAQLAETMPGVGILLAILVLVFGHVVNLALGIMSGVVHGLRLNFIEFFGWSFSDEGYPFKAFARRETVS
jgi:V/A-type H+/Na+-transporting ATPase subunit I